MMLLDTSGLYSLRDSTDPFHGKAHQHYRSAQRLMTHSYVLAEWVALAHVRRVPRPAALQYLVDVQNQPDIETVWVSEALHREAVALLRARLDKTYSLCDAVSFVLMRRRKLTDALTTDRHFEQAGFHRLLK